MNEGLGGGDVTKWVYFEGTAAEREGRGEGGWVGESDASK